VLARHGSAPCDRRARLAALHLRLCPLAGLPPLGFNSGRASWDGDLTRNYPRSPSSSAASSSQAGLNAGRAVSGLPGSGVTKPARGDRALLRRRYVTGDAPRVSKVIMPVTLTVTDVKRIVALSVTCRSVGRAVAKPIIVERATSGFASLYPPYALMCGGNALAHPLSPLSFGAPCSIPGST
jgi:hypothetical protein